MEQPIDFLALFRAYERDFGRYEHHVDLMGLAEARAHQRGENVGDLTGERDTFASELRTTRVDNEVAAALTTGAVADAFDLDKLIDAASTMDDPRAQKTLFISRKTLAKLQKANRNAYVPAADTDLGFDQFAGYNLIITETFGDNLTVVAQNGALAFGAGLVPGEVGMEIDRDPNAGNGGGGEILRMPWYC